MRPSERGRVKAGKRAQRRPENTLLVLGGVVAALALLALIFGARGYRRPVERAIPLVRIEPTFVGTQLVFQERNVGKDAAVAMHTACIVRNTDADAWPVLTLHPPASDQPLRGEDLPAGGSLRIALEACINARNIATYPASAYFLVRYFTSPNEEHVEETLLDIDARDPSKARFESADPSDPSHRYRDLLLAHLRRYAPPPA
jgi:hypothetical protein